MTSIRLLPVVVFAACALLALKGVGLVTHGGYVLVGTGTAVAQTASADAPKLNESDIQAAERASDNLFANAAPVPADAAQTDAAPVTQTTSGDKVALDTLDGSDNSKQAVLDRLSERRAELDKQSSDLDTRQALVEAAEKRLAERIKDLKAVEAHIQALVDEKKTADDKQFAGVVSMYETMKPKDAAAIFNSLGSDVLVRVAAAMNPRKLAPVLAAMQTDKAQMLTMQLAQAEPEPALDAPINDTASLPQIVGN